MFSPEKLAAKVSRQAGSVSVFEGLMRNDAALVKAGFPPISPWWKQVLKEFYQTGKLRLVGRVGRRGGKSSTLIRVAVAEAMYGQHQVPPGDIGSFVFVSVREDEAKDRLRGINQILKTLRVPHEAKAKEIVLRDRPIQFKIYPANFRTIVGMTCIGFVADECARWRDDALGANPAKEVLASLRPAMATMPKAHEFLSSSPWAKTDAHFEHYEKGNNESQNVAHAPSWIANPTLSIERCRQLEPDEPTFEREYGAIPMESEASQFFDNSAIEHCMSQGAAPFSRAKPGEKSMAGSDFAFSSDWSAIVVAHLSPDGKYRIGETDILKPTPGRPLVPSEVCQRFASVLRKHGLKGLMADGHYREAIVEHLSGNGIAFFSAPRRPASAYVRFRALMYQGQLAIPKNDDLRKRLLEIKSRPTLNGSISILTPRKKEGGHSDDISAMVLACYQRNGVVVPIAKQMPAEANGMTRRKFVQEGWTEAEMKEVRDLEREILKKTERIGVFREGMNYGRYR